VKSSTCTACREGGPNILYLLLDKAEREVYLDLNEKRSARDNIREPKPERSVARPSMKEEERK